MCLLIQEVLSNNGSVEDFNNAALNVRDFHIDMQSDFLRRPLLHLLIIDIYNKRGRCATELRARHPNVYNMQLTGLVHMLQLGANVNLGVTVKIYSALQIAVYLSHCTAQHPTTRMVMYNERSVPIFTHQVASFGILSQRSREHNDY